MTQNSKKKSSSSNNNKKSHKKKKQEKCSAPAARWGHVLAEEGDVQGALKVSEEVVSRESKGFFLFGGDGKEELRDVWRLDSGSKGWTCIHDPSSSSSSSLTPLPRVMAAGCAAGEYLYLFGGMRQEGGQLLVFNDLWEFSILSREWRCLQEEVPGVSERSGAVMKALKYKGGYMLFLHGGECLGQHFGDSFVTSHFVLEEKEDGRHTPSQQEVLFTRLPNASSALLPPSPPADDSIHTPGQDGSNSMSLAPPPRSSHSLAVVSSFPSPSPLLILFGGTANMEDGETVYFNDTWMLRADIDCDVTTWQWRPLQSTDNCELSLAPSPRSLCAMLPLRSRLVVPQEFDAADLLDGNDVDVGDGRAFHADILLYGGYGLLETDDDYEEDVKVDSNETTDDIDEASARLGLEDMSINKENKEDEDQGVVEGYLSDVWAIDIEKGSFCEIVGDFQTVPCGGHSLAHVDKDSIVSFGGFDGSNFHCLSPVIPLNRLKRDIDV